MDGKKGERANVTGNEEGKSGELRMQKGKRAKRLGQEPDSCHSCDLERVTCGLC